MKYLMTYAANSKTPPTPEQMAAIGKYGQEMTEAGVLLMTGGLIRPNNGTRVALSGGKFTVTDGPCAETKELIDGFARVACGGTHIKRTGEVGPIKLKRNNIGKGKERIEIFLTEA